MKPLLIFIILIFNLHLLAQEEKPKKHKVKPHYVSLAIGISDPIKPATEIDYSSTGLGLKLESAWFITPNYGIVPMISYDKQFVARKRLKDHFNDRWYRFSDISDIKAKPYTFFTMMLGQILQFKISPKSSLYVQGNIGFLHSTSPEFTITRTYSYNPFSPPESYDFVEPKHTDLKFSYQGVLGYKVQVKENWGIDFSISYREGMADYSYTQEARDLPMNSNDEIKFLNYLVGIYYNIKKRE